jgi:hypothetical protein
VTTGQACDVGDDIMGLELVLPSMHLDACPLTVSSPSTSPSTSDHVLHGPDSMEVTMKVDQYHASGCRSEYD